MCVVGCVCRGVLSYNNVLVTIFLSLGFVAMLCALVTMLYVRMTMLYGTVCHEGYCAT